MAKIYLGNLSAIEYLGVNEKEFTRSPFTPKPIVKQGDIIILEKIHAHNISKLLPTEWRMWDKNYIEVREDEELLEIIEEYDSHVKELEAVVAEHDLKKATDEDTLKSILQGIEDGTITIESLSDYDRELYNKHIDNILVSSSTGILEEYTNPVNETLKEVLGDKDEPKIIDDEISNIVALKPIGEFNTKEELEDYALKEFGFELDEELTLEEMYKSLEDIINPKVEE